MPFLEAVPEAREFEIVEVVKMTLLRKVLNTLSLGKRAGGCHGAGLATDGNGFTKIGIVGSPNVGKGVVFNRLTRRYVTVSNYPGTTVNVSRGKAKMEDEEFEVIDTPGMYTLLPITEEDRVARSILLEEKPEVILHVVDARNLERLLPLTLFVPCIAQFSVMLKERGQKRR